MNCGFPALGMFVEHVGTPVRHEPDPERFRQVLGHFCTGITIITAVHDGEPVGFSCQAFAALSLDPPLVLFCPARSSSTWPRIEQAGHFCANVLTADQGKLATLFGRSNSERFSEVDWTPDSTGSPIIDGVLTWISCRIADVHTIGDHYVVIGEVLGLGECGPDRPLLFYRGRYGTPSAPAAEGPPEVVETMLAWPKYADWM
ncbi:MAG TPA: flavin reductase family protein [Streptosporangiaceae bacterium]|jgi:3-hydroxy-9,10-secoandrosta-1,3,5(10)-triene-9,17-dione monooxygenase reductase component|nr:flavin reductase family protein [Streptosporangiaceae bacterium]